MDSFEENDDSGISLVDVCSVMGVTGEELKWAFCDLMKNHSDLVEEIIDNCLMSGVADNGYFNQFVDARREK